MPFPEPWSRLKKEILAEIKPTERDKNEISSFITNLKAGLKKALAKEGVDSDIEVHGSVARDTWLKGQRDIDVFIILRHGSDRRDLFRVNEVIKSHIGKGWIEAYAEHPYVKKVVEGFTVEFIPCFRAEAGKGFSSSTDRSPLHTGYLQPRLTESTRDEIRVLKAFMMGIGVYGAEIKVGGFSGYLCELLVLAYVTFDDLIEAAVNWGEHPVILLDEGVSPKKFGEPLVVLDPVDSNRNVASAVTEKSLWTFVAASRAFSEKPSTIFFNPKKRVTSRLREELKNRDPEVLFIVISDENPPVPDTLWGQLYRTEKAFARALTEGGFKVFRSGSWSDEAKRHILVYELESASLPHIIRKTGPPVRLLKESRDFLRTYVDSPGLVSGPGIEGERWWVEVIREHTSIRNYLAKVQSSGYEEIGVPKRLACLLGPKCSFYLNEEIEGELFGDFPHFLEPFLKGRADWLG